MRALWTGKPVDWDGRWTVKGGVLAPVPARPGGPPLWAAGAIPAALERVGRQFDGWFPNNPDPAAWGERWQQVLRAARTAGRDPAALTGAAYLTLAIDEDRANANRRLDGFFENYYGQPAAVMRARQANFAGTAADAAAWLRAWAAAGAQHLVLRFAGDAERHLEAVARLRGAIG
jgi:alkanesulfonate monooxygenase SsuD/methylene tetrahydromethanopterin reductase-like flavin-dependent oxidoreductase (luciferase family)